jgi:Rrf2 family protein
MKVGSKAYYGFLALVELANNYKIRRTTQVKEIAKDQDIPSEYLGQIMVLLNRARLVHGSRGPGGGYILARPPETISVKEVIEVLEGPFVSLDVRPKKKSGSGALATERLMQAWGKGVAAMETILEDTTLADLCKPEQESYMYYI